MRLTRAEFNRIRPLQWNLKQYGHKVYNTPMTQTETQLFWLDFIRLVFAPKFKRQYGITRIPTFDQTQPVLLTDDLNLVLPASLETAMYYANNPTVPMSFSINVSQLSALVVGIVLILGLLVLNVLYGNRFPTRFII